MPLEAIQLLGNGKGHGQVSGAFVGHPGVFGVVLRMFDVVNLTSDLITEVIVSNNLSSWP